MAIEHPRPERLELLRHYWPIMRQIPQIVWQEASKVGKMTTIILIVLFLLTAFNGVLAQSISDSWRGISPWWSTLFLGALVICALLKAEYYRFLKVRDDCDAAQGKCRSLQTLTESLNGKITTLDVYREQLSNTIEWLKSELEKCSPYKRLADTQRSSINQYLSCVIGSIDFSHINSPTNPLITIGYNLRNASANAIDVSHHLVDASIPIYDGANNGTGTCHPLPNKGTLQHDAQIPPGQHLQSTVDISLTPGAATILQQASGSAQWGKLRIRVEFVPKIPDDTAARPPHIVSGEYKRLVSTNPEV